MRSIKANLTLADEISEADIQRALVQHLWMRAPPDVVWFSCPNGGYRLRTEAARFKGLGVKAGVSDMILLRAGVFYALELKTLRGRTTPAQDKFLDDVRLAGGRAAVTYGLNHALETLRQ